MKRFAGLGLVAGTFLAACVTTEPGAEFRVDPKAPYVTVKLATVVAAPHQYRDTDIIFNALYNADDEGLFIPAYTPFVEEKFHAFSVIVPGTRIWDRDAAVDGTVRTMYIRKDNPALARVVQAARYQPVIVKGRVRSHFDDQPWVEVYGFATTGGPIYSAKGLRAMLMGFDAIDANNLDVARSSLKVAASAMPTPEARAEIYHRLGRALIKRKNLPDAYEAVGYFQRALGYSEDEMAVRVDLERAQMIIGMLERGEDIERIEEWPEDTGGAGEPAEKEPRAEQLVALIQELQATIRLKDAEIDRLRNAPTEDLELVKDLNEAHAAIEALTGQVQAAKDALDAKDLEVQAARDQTEQNLRQTEQAELRAVTAEKKAGDFEAAVRGYEDQNQALREALDERERDMAQKEQLANQKIDQLAAAKAEVEEQVQILEASLAELTAGKGADDVLKSRLEEAQKTIGRLETERKNLTEQLKAAQAGGGQDVEALRLRITENEDEIDSLKERIESLRRTIEEQRARIKELEGGGK